MKKLLLILFVVSSALLSQTLSAGPVEQSIIYDRAKDSIEKSYDRMEERREALTTPAPAISPEPLRPQVSVTTESPSSPEIAAPASRENSASKTGECNRKIFMQLRIIENQRRKIQELQRQLEKKK